MGRIRSLVAWFQPAHVLVASTLLVAVLIAKELLVRNKAVVLGANAAAAALSLVYAVAYLTMSAVLLHLPAFRLAERLG